MKFLKAFKKWGDAQNWWQTSLWSAAIIGCLILTDYNLPLAAILFLLIVGIMCLCVARRKLPLTIALISCLLFQPVKRSHAVQDCNAAVIGGVVVVVGAIIIYKLVKFCKKHFPPPPPPPPPPTPHDTNGANTNNPSFHYTASLLAQSHQIDSIDISTNGWLDYTQTNNPVPFQDFIILTFSGSPDLVTWTNCVTIDLWLSSNSVETAVYDWNSQPIYTNWVSGNPYTTCLTNLLPVGIIPDDKQHFFRDY